MYDLWSFLWFSWLSDNFGGVFCHCAENTINKLTFTFCYECYDRQLTVSVVKYFHPGNKMLPYS